MLVIEILFWYWWVAAVVLLTVELLAPGFFFIWMAAAAFITGSFLLLFPFLTPDIQVFIFSVLSIVSVLVWRQFFKKNLTETDRPHLNKRGSQYIGQEFTLQKAIVNGQGQLLLAGINWTVKGPDCGPGHIVRVVAVIGTYLQVEIVQEGALSAKKD